MTEGIKAFDVSVVIEHETSRYACDPSSIEQVIPKPYSGASVEGPVKIDGFHLEITGVFVDEVFGRRHVAIACVVNERGDYGPKGRREGFRFSGSFPVDRPLALCVRELALNALRHELEECLMVGGVRIWDPHLSGRPGGL